MLQIIVKRFTYKINSNIAIYSNAINFKKEAFANPLYSIPITRCRQTSREREPIDYFMAKTYLSRLREKQSLDCLETEEPFYGWLTETPFKDARTDFHCLFVVSVHCALCECVLGKTSACSEHTETAESKNGPSSSFIWPRAGCRG